MPPEMITIVAPIAMIAKKLASVAVWISVYEFQKLLTDHAGIAIEMRAGQRGECNRHEDDDDHESGFLQVDRRSGRAAR